MSVTIRSFSLVQNLNMTKCALQRPPNQLYTRSTQRHPLLACNSGGSQPSIFPEILRSHKRHLEIILNKHAGYELGLIFLLRVVGWRRVRGQFADHFGSLVSAEGDPHFLAVAGAVNFNFVDFVGVEGEEFGFETHHVVLFAVDEDLHFVLIYVFIGLE